MKILLLIGFFLLGMTIVVVASPNLFSGAWPQSFVERTRGELLEKFAASRYPFPMVPQVYPPDLPKQFDSRQQWPGCIGAAGILDQGRCGSCWAFASTGGKVNVTLSPQSLLECEKDHYYCLMGSMPEWTWSFLVREGSATLQCLPYTSGDGKEQPSACTQACADPAVPYAKYYAANYSQAGDFLEPRLHVAAIMRALLQGPLDATFMEYSDFNGYQPGTVYQISHGAYPVGLHSVKIIGYGVSNNTDMWIVQNSWGADWGDNGYFMYIRGKDEGGFESQVFTGFPKF